MAGKTGPELFLTFFKIPKPNYPGNPVRMSRANNIVREELMFRWWHTATATRPSALFPIFWRSPPPGVYTPQQTL